MKFTDVSLSVRERYSLIEDGKDIKMSPLVGYIRIARAEISEGKDTYSFKNEKAILSVWKYTESWHLTIY